MRESRYGVGAFSPSSLITQAQVARVRWASESTMKSGTTSFSRSHAPAAGASRFPRAARGRPWSLTPSG